MTLRDKLFNKVYNMGVGANEANEMLDYATQQVDQVTPVKWKDEATSYPPTLPGVLWLSMRPHLLEWIKVNKPQAWYRPMFS
jgi:hypothetical protein